MPPNSNHKLSLIESWYTWQTIGQLVKGRQHLWLPVCFHGYQAPSKKRFSLHGKGLLREGFGGGRFALGGFGVENILSFRCRPLFTRETKHFERIASTSNKSIPIKDLKEVNYGASTFKWVKYSKHSRYLPATRVTIHEETFESLASRSLSASWNATEI